MTERIRRRFRNGQSDQSSLSAWRNIWSLAIHWAHSKDSDQTGQMPRLIWVFCWCTIILLVLSWGGLNILWFLAWNQVEGVRRIRGVPLIKLFQFYREFVEKLGQTWIFLQTWQNRTPRGGYSCIGTVRVFCTGKPHPPPPPPFLAAAPNDHFLTCAARKDPDFFFIIYICFCVIFSKPPFFHVWASSESPFSVRGRSLSPLFKPSVAHIHHFHIWVLPSFILPPPPTPLPHGIQP